MKEKGRDMYRSIKRGVDWKEKERGERGRVKVVGSAASDREGERGEKRERREGEREEDTCREKSVYMYVCVCVCVCSVCLRMEKMWYTHVCVFMCVCVFALCVCVAREVTRQRQPRKADTITSLSFSSSRCPGLLES